MEEESDEDPGDGDNMVGDDGQMEDQEMNWGPFKIIIA